MQIRLFFLSFIVLLCSDFKIFAIDCQQYEIDDYVLVAKYKHHEQESYFSMSLLLLEILLKSQDSENDSIFLNSNFLSTNVPGNDFIEAIPEFKPLHVSKGNNLNTYKISLDEYDLCLFSFEPDIELIDVFIAPALVTIPVIIKDQLPHSEIHKSYDESTIDTLIDDLNGDGIFDHHTGPVAASGIKGFFIKLGVNILYYSHRMGMAILNRLHLKKA